MASQENETPVSNKDAESKKQPFKWNDELIPKEQSIETEDDGQSYTSVAELLEAEDEKALKRLVEYLQKLIPSSK
jgi:hypothetical protein